MTTPSSTAGTGWWVAIEREHGADLYVGPYPSADAAELACENALLIDDLTAVDCLGCWVTSEEPAADVEQVIVDLEDSHHTGR